MGFIDFTNGEVLTADQMDTVMRQSVMKFADASARDTALSAVLAEGMMCYLDSTNEVLKYDGSSWIDISGDITGVTAGTALTGGGTSGNVTLDVDTAAVGSAIGIDDKQDDVITTQGDLVIGDASGNPIRLAVGTADQVLTSDGTTVSFQDAGGGGADLFTGVNYQIITSTQSVTISTDHMAFVLGGGGAGGGTGGIASASGGGGGSGFISNGTLSAGTYTATIGAGGTGSTGDGTAGGTTSIGTVTANGGDGGTAPVTDSTNPGDGGNGGSGGGAGIGGNGFANDGIAGFDGQDAVAPTTGSNQGTVGTSSDSRVIGENFISDYLIDPAETGTLTQTAAGVYAGGCGGDTLGRANGLTPTAFGAGGNGADQDNNGLSRSGGDGANGVILLVEL